MTTVFVKRLENPRWLSRLHTTPPQGGWEFSWGRCPDRSDRCLSIVSADSERSAKRELLCRHPRLTGCVFAPLPVVEQTYNADNGTNSFTWDEDGRKREEASNVCWAPPDAKHDFLRAHPHMWRAEFRLRVTATVEVHHVDLPKIELRIAGEWLRTSLELGECISAVAANWLARRLGISPSQIDLTRVASKAGAYSPVSAGFAAPPAKPGVKFRTPTDPRVVASDVCLDPPEHYCPPRAAPEGCRTSPPVKPSGEWRSPAYLRAEIDKLKARVENHTHGSAFGPSSPPLPTVEERREKWHAGALVTLGQRGFEVAQTPLWYLRRCSMKRGIQGIAGDFVSTCEGLLRALITWRNKGYEGEVQDLIDGYPQ